MNVFTEGVEGIFPKARGNKYHSSFLSSALSMLPTL